VVDGRIGHYQVTLKVGFRLAPETPAGDEDTGGGRVGGVSGIGTA
jgi:hypothetical protein